MAVEQAQRAVREIEDLRIDATCRTCGVWECDAGGHDGGPHFMQCDACGAEPCTWFGKQGLGPDLCDGCAPKDDRRGG